MGKKARTERALLLRLKPDGGCLSNACVMVCVVSNGLNLHLGGGGASLSVSGRCWRGETRVLTGQSHSCMIWTHKHYTHTHKGSSFVLCIIYETLPLSLVLHLESTQCQEKSHMHVDTPCRHVSVCSLTIFSKQKTPVVFSKIELFLFN